MPRTATVVAEQPVSVLSVPGDALRVALQARGGAVAELLESDPSGGS